LATLNEPNHSPEARIGRLEEKVSLLLASLQALKSELTDIQKVMESLDPGSNLGAGRYVASCPACSTRYDMLAHHYSIGLFDNMVYVKCPKCNKALPLQGGAGGDVAIVADEGAP
jgi:hypothetical protein